MNRLYRILASLCGAVISFFTGIPMIMWVLVGVMTLDYATGLICGAAGKSPKTEGGGLSSRTAFTGLMRKCMILGVVLLAVLLDCAVQAGAGVSFSAVTGATCLWFIASEGVSILENAAALGLPIPQVLTRTLETLRTQQGGETQTQKGEQ